MVQGISTVTYRRRNSTALGAAHRRCCARMDPPWAIKASAYQLLRIIYSMVANQHQSSETPLLEAKRMRRLHKIQRIICEAENCGLCIVEEITDVNPSNQTVA